MTSRQIQVIAGLAIVIAIAVGLVVIADNNRQKIAARMEAEKADAVAKKAEEAASGTEEQQAAAGETAEAETKAEAEKPSFDVARFEPTGDGVLAGLAKPGSIVELLANGQPISTTTANEVGEWVIVLEKPLQAGNHDLTVRATAPEGEPAISEDFIAVVVPDTPSGEVLVVATRAGEPSEILSLPSTSSGSTATDGGKQADSGTATEMASSESAAPVKSAPDGQTAAKTGMASENTQGSEQETQMAATDTAPSGVAGSEGAPEKSASPKSAGQNSTGQNSAGQNSAAMTEGSSGESQTVDSQDSNASESVAGSATEETAQASQPTATVDAPGQQASAADTMGTETEIAETASESLAPTAESTQMAAETPQTNEAADVPPETASARSPAETAETAEIAETAVTGDEGESGKMAADLDKPTSESMQMASADQDADTPLSGSLASASEQETEMAEAQGEAESVPAPVAEAASAPAPVAEAPKRVFKLALDAVETEGSMVYAAGTGNPGAKVRVYADDTFIGETAANDSGRWLLETNAEIAAGNVVVRADELASGGTDVVQRAEVPFLKQADAIALLPTTASTGGGASEFSSGAVTGPTSVIIRKGDNLWTISRRTYGRGVRYTTIYQANDDQIRNPHMIFPGQVFVLPKGEKNWVQ